MSKEKMKEKRPFSVAMVMEGGDHAVLTVCGVIGYDDGADAITFCDAVDEALKSGAKALTVRINSVGGVCTDGLAMGDKLQTCGVPVRCEVFGCAESMAAYLLQCGTERVAHRHATIMIHQPRCCIIGCVDELVERARYLAEMRDSMFEVMGKRCGKTGAELSAAHAVEKNYTARAALAYGLLDSIVGEEGESTQDEAEEPVENQEPAAACRLMPYEAGMQALAMCGACVAEGDEDEPDKKPEGEPDEKPEDEPDEQTEGEPDEKPEGEPDEKPAGKPDKKPAESCGLTREQVAEMCREAAAQGAAKALANMGMPAESLPSPGKPAPMKAARPTVEMLDRMDSMARLRALEMHPDLVAEYMARR